MYAEIYIYNRKLHGLGFFLVCALSNLNITSVPSPGTTRYSLPNTVPAEVCALQGSGVFEVRFKVFTNVPSLLIQVNLWLDLYYILSDRGKKKRKKKS